MKNKVVEKEPDSSTELEEEFKEEIILDEVEEINEAEVTKVLELWGKNGVAGFYVRIAGSYKLLTREEEKELAVRYRNGDEGAKEKLILHNLRYPIFFANLYQNCGLDVTDLIQEGNIGLTKAAERYDPDFVTKLGQKAKFGSYASWWIKQAMRRALGKHSRTIRLPSHIVDKISKMRQAEQKLREKTGDDPSPKDVAKAMGVKSEKISDWRRLSLKVKSLSAPIDEEDGADFEALIADKSSISPSSMVLASERFDILCRVIGKIFYVLECLASHPKEERSIQIVRYFYGLNGKMSVFRRYRTLDETGEKFQITRERVRQILVTTWLKVAAICPDLPSNEEDVMWLFEHLHVLADTLKTEMVFDSDLSAIERKNIAEKAARPSLRRIDHKKKGATSKWRPILASLSFETWTPAKPSERSLPELALRLASIAYEVPLTQIDRYVQKSRGEIKWAQDVAVYLIWNETDLTQDVVAKLLCVVDHENGDESVSDRCKTVEKAVARDERVKEDIDRIRAHFRRLLGVE